MHFAIPAVPSTTSLTTEGPEIPQLSPSPLSMNGMTAATAVGTSAEARSSLTEPMFLRPNSEHGLVVMSIGLGLWHAKLPPGSPAGGAFTSGVPLYLSKDCLGVTSRWALEWLSIFRGTWSGDGWVTVDELSGGRGARQR